MNWAITILRAEQEKLQKQAIWNGKMKAEFIKQSVPMCQKLADDCKEVLHRLEEVQKGIRVLKSNWNSSK